LNAKDALGKHGEQLAAEYLQQAGFWILDRNWRCAGTGTPAVTGPLLGTIASGAMRCAPAQRLATNRIGL